MELRKLRHDPMELLTRAIQPALWLAVFGEVFTRFRAIPTGDLRYLDFMAPGVLAQSVLFIAIFYGISAIWERDLGLVHKLLASPASRSALVLGKSLSAGVRGLSQAAIVYLLAWLMGVDVDWHPGALAGVAVAVALGAAAFSTFSLIIAPRENARALHGHRPGADHAAVPGQQRHLSHLDHAALAASRRPGEPAVLRGGRHARADGARRHRRLRRRPGLGRPRGHRDGVDDRGGPPLSESRSLSSAPAPQARPDLGVASERFNA